jgi:hypothetical protein
MGLGKKPSKPASWLLVAPKIVEEENASRGRLPNRERSVLISQQLLMFVSVSPGLLRLSIRLIGKDRGYAQCGRLNSSWVIIGFVSERLSTPSEAPMMRSNNLLIWVVALPQAPPPWTVLL